MKKESVHLGNNSIYIIYMYFLKKGHLACKNLYVCMGNIYILDSIHGS